MQAPPHMKQGIMRRVRLYPSFYEQVPAYTSPEGVLARLIDSMRPTVKLGFTSQLMALNGQSPTMSLGLAASQVYQITQLTTGYLQLLQSVLDDSVLDVSDVDDQHPPKTVFHMPPRDSCMEVNTIKMVLHAQSAGPRKLRWFNGRYVHLTIGRSGRNKILVTAHQFVLWAIKGPPNLAPQNARDGMPYTKVHCMHVCNNPRCLNPLHLAWGWTPDNLRRCKRTAWRRWLCRALEQHHGIDPLIAEQYSQTALTTLSTSQMIEHGNTIHCLNSLGLAMQRFYAVPG